MTPELATVIEGAIDDDRIDLHTALPGRVVRLVGNKVDIEVLDRFVPDGRRGMVAESIGVLAGVKVWSLRTRKFFVRIPIAKGDEGLVIFTEAPIGAWLAGGGSVPEDAGRHTLAGAVFLPGLVIDSVDDALVPQTDGALFGAVNGAYVSVQEDGTIEMQNAAGSVELAPTGQCAINGSNFTVDP
jgi:hypothetical protein